MELPQTLLTLLFDGILEDLEAFVSLNRSWIDEENPPCLLLLSPSLSHQKIFLKRLRILFIPLTYGRLTGIKSGPYGFGDETLQALQA